MCLNEPLCKDSVLAEGNMCMLLANDTHNMDITSKLQGTAVYTKFDRVVTGINSNSEVCDKGFFVFNNSGVISCFKPHKKDVTWRNAKRACGRNGTYSAKLDTKPKLMFLAKATQNDFYYIGLRQKYNDTLRWSDGSQANISNAISFLVNPSHCKSNVCCVYMQKTRGIRTFLLVLDNCDTHYRYICKKQPNQ